MSGLYPALGEENVFTRSQYDRMVYLQELFEKGKLHNQGDRVLLAQLQSRYTAYVQQQQQLHRLYQAQQRQAQTPQPVQTPQNCSVAVAQREEPRFEKVEEFEKVKEQVVEEKKKVEAPQLVQKPPVEFVQQGTPETAYEGKINFSAIRGVPVRLPEDFPTSFSFASETSFPVKTTPSLLRASSNIPNSGDPFFIYVNGTKHTLDSVDPTMTLNAFLRSLPGLKGTKKSCGEGGCGVCTVVLADSPSSPEEGPIARSINSCLRPLVACYGKSVTTVEGLGSQKKGYHPIQSRLAEADGTQCGFCSPGFVMNMYSLLENNPAPTKEEVEKYFDGNICRCTGFRPILDAFKSFATEGPEEEHEKKKCAGVCSKSGEGCKNSCKLSKVVPDIEELHLPEWGEYKHESAHHVVKEKVFPPNRFALRGVEWLSPSSLSEVYSMMSQNPGASLVFGHTSQGIYKDWAPSTFIDLQNVPELKGNTYDSRQNALIFGGTTTINEFLAAIKAYQGSSSLSPTQKVVFPDLLYLVGRVANTQIRNAGSIAGNLMLANLHSFPSDLCIALIGLQASVVLANSDGETPMALCDFVHFKAAGYVLKSVVVPLGLPGLVYKTYKVAIRNVNSHALVNSAFLATVAKGMVTNPPVIAFGNIRAKQARMPQTEQVLEGAPLAEVATLQKALTTLAAELNVDQSIGRNEYRKSVALGMFYKFYLSLLPAGSIPPSIASGMTKFSRGVSSGEQSYQTDPSEYPVSEPIHKLKGHQQTSGEAQYTDDIPSPAGTLHGAFVISTVASATISAIDASPALALPGVVAWVDASDIPGKNNTDINIPIFATNQVQYCGQAIGMIVATSQDLANRASKLVSVTYSNVQQPIITIPEAIVAGSIYPAPIPPVQLGDVTKGLQESDYVIKGKINFGGQYHFHMETQSALIVPGENNEIQAYVATQMSAFVQTVLANTLGISSNKVYVQVKRCGGGYGGKLTNSEPLPAALAVAAYKLGVPVRGVMDIDTQMQMLGRRPSHYAEYTLGLMKSGQIHALSVDTWSEGGAAPNDSVFTVMGLLSSLDSSYYIPNFLAQGKLCKTNTAPNTAVRGPGWTPAIHMMEHIVEHGAAYLNMESSAFKELNFFKKGQTLPDGTPLKYWNLDIIWSQLKSTADYDTRLQAVNTFNQSNTWKKRGLAIVPCRWAAGWAGDHQSCVVNIYPDGSVVVYHSGVEIGQGIDTKVAQVVAYKLGIPLDIITVLNHNSALSPNVGPTGGSVASSLCCTAAGQACDELNKRLAPVRSLLQMGGDALTWAQLIAKALGAGINLQAQGDIFPPPGPLSPSIAYNSYSAAVQEVELDVLTGEIQLLRTDILFDAGISLNPAVDVGQVEGAFVMGLGLNLTEEVLYDEAGALITRNTWEYKPTSALDIPLDFRVSLLKDAPNPLDFLSSKLTGEPPLALSCVALFAVQNAVKAFRKDTKQDVQDFCVTAPVTVDVAQAGCGITQAMLSF